MRTFKIPESLYPKYQGCGYGLVATVHGQIVDLKYFDDISDDFQVDSETMEDIDDRLKEIIQDSRLEKTVKQFDLLGDVHVGMFSSYEFCEL